MRGRGCRRAPLGRFASLVEGGEVGGERAIQERHAERLGDARRDEVAARAVLGRHRDDRPLCGDGHGHLFTEPTGPQTARDGDKTHPRRMLPRPRG